ncbi:MAG: YigZ family protein [Bacteroidaceae bacterium]|nr:YigZ family protein [Bacteroidaceae bacterium]
MDEYKTITETSQGTYSEKRSKFLAFAHHVTSVDEVKELVAFYQKKYYDARHCCYAYALGPTAEVFRANDNGEPSGTAGKPILGQIRSNELTDVLIVIIRYFGGVKLGTSGLIVAYREAAADAILNATIVTKTVDDEISFSFEYPMMNDVMRVVKDVEPRIVSQSYDNDCLMTLSIRRSLMPRLRERLSKVETLCFIDSEQ